MWEMRSRISHYAAHCKSTRCVAHLCAQRVAMCWCSAWWFFFPLGNVKAEACKTYLCARNEAMLLRSALCFSSLSPSLPLPPALVLLNPARLAAWSETMLRRHWLASLVHTGRAPPSAAPGSRSRPHHESFSTQSQWCVLIGRLPTLPLFLISSRGAK